MVKLNSRYIRELMGSKGMSVRDMAYIMGVSPGSMQRRLDNGETDAIFARRMAETLNVPIVEITLGN